MMLMRLIPMFWLGLDGQLLPSPTVQKLRVNFQAAKRAAPADGHAGILLDSELLPEEASTGQETRVHPVSTADAKRLFFPVLRPAICSSRGARVALTAERKNRISPTQKRRNTQTR